MTTPIIYFSHGNAMKDTVASEACIEAISEQWPDHKIWNPAKCDMKRLAATRGGWDQLYEDIITRMQATGGHMVVLENGPKGNKTIGRGVFNEVSCALRCSVTPVPVYAWRSGRWYPVSECDVVDDEDWTYRYAACNVGKPTNRTSAPVAGTVAPQ